MNLILAKILLVVAMSHGLRMIGRSAGPRWGGLALGLPCTTAVALAGCGLDRGVSFSLDMADHCLLGLAGAVVLPLAFAEATRRGLCLAGCVVAAASAYFASAWVAGLSSPFLVGGGLGLASLAVLAGTSLAARWEDFEPDRDEPRPTSPWRTMVLRTAVPVLCLMAVLVAGELSGPRASGLLGTFPGLGLTFLILTHLEGGPKAALGLARSLPPGNFGMVAFLGSFRFASEHAGLGWGMAAGYLAALVVLASVALHGTRSPRWSRLAKDPQPAPIWPRPGRTFFPGVESLAA